MAAVSAAAVVTAGDRLGLTFCLAILFHTIVILGVAFTPERKKAPSYETMEIVLVQSRSEPAPEAAQFRAQANQVGGGNDEETARPATPLSTPLPAAVAAVPTAPAPLPEPPVPPASAQAPLPAAAMQVEPEPKETQEPANRTAKTELLAETAKPDKPLVKPSPPSRNRPEKTTAKAKSDQPATSRTEGVAKQDDATGVPAPAAAPSAAALIARSFAIASLNAEIQERLEAKAKRPRRKFISANTKEYKYAAYMEAWRAKVERIGNLNYPDEARREKLSGNLILDVALNADGSINEITVRRPSDHQVLDDAAIRIVRLAAPYAPFPDNFNRDVDILHITRTWQFMSSERFAASP